MCLTKELYIIIALTMYFGGKVYREACCGGAKSATSCFHVDPYIAT